MSTFQAFMDSVLPALQGIRAALNTVAGTFTSPRGPTASNPSRKTHGAVDFSYGSSVTTQDLTRPPVYCPIDGEITMAGGGKNNTVKIRDSQGYSHEILHMTNVQVKTGPIKAGSKLGRMGNTGMGYTPGSTKNLHVHYQLKTPGGALMNPVTFWNGNKQVFTGEHPQGNEDLNGPDLDPPHSWTEPANPVGNIQEYTPRQAGIAERSYAGSALWTNRVPQHEPWARTMMVDTPDLNKVTDEHGYNINHNPQFTDETDDGRKSIGRIDGDEVYERGPFWRR